MAMFAPLIFTFAAAHAAEAVPADRIFFDSNRTGNFEIFPMNLDGTGVAQLTQDRALGQSRCHMGGISSDC
jgi:hypothetical protein